MELDLPQQTETQLENLEELMETDAEQIVAQLVNDAHAQVSQQLVMEGGPQNISIETEPEEDSETQSEE